MELLGQVIASVVTSGIVLVLVGVVYKSLLTRLTRAETDLKDQVADVKLVNADIKDVKENYITRLDGIKTTLNNFEVKVTERLIRIETTMENNLKQYIE